MKRQFWFLPKPGRLRTSHRQCTDSWLFAEFGDNVAGYGKTAEEKEAEKIKLTDILNIITKNRAFPALAQGSTIMKIINREFCVPEHGPSISVVSRQLIRKRISA